MAKELPYFQFEPGEYLTGNIQFCTLGAQGLFTNIISIYWQRECNFTLEQLKRKFENEILIKELLDEKIIKVDKKNNLIISFLDKQFIQITDKKKLLSDAGRKGALKKKQATLKPPLSDPEAIREEKRREEKSKEVNRYIYSEFYDTEILNSQNNPDYLFLVKFLFGENEIKKPLANVLKLQDQITFDQFKKLLLKYKETGVKITDLLFEMEGWKDLPKKCKVVSLVLQNWMNRKGEKKQWIK